MPLQSSGEISFSQIRTEMNFSSGSNTSATHPTTTLTSNTSDSNYVASASSGAWWSPAYLAFDNSSRWESASGVYSDINYVGGVTTTVDGVSVAGEWIQLEFMNGVTNISSVVYSGTGLQANFGQIVVCASNNQTTFTQLLATGHGYIEGTYNISSNKSYRYVRTICLKKFQGGNSFCTINEWKINGIIGVGGQVSIEDFRASGSTKARGVTGIPTSGQISFADFRGKEAIPVVSGLIAKYTGESWNGSTLVDETGSGYNTNANKGGAISTTTSSNNSLKYMTGGTGAGLQFPTGILPSTYTAIFLTRYNGTNRLRIMDGINQNWLSGHWNGRSGVAFHEGWVHYSDVDYYNNTWVLSTDQINLYRSNGQERGTSGGTSSTRLSLNYGMHTGVTYNENSDWAFYCLFVYNRNLSISEILQMEEYLRNRYQTFIMTTYNWYTLFNRINSNFTISQSGSDPDVQLQMNSTATGSSNTSLWYSQRIQNYSQFVAEFEIYMSGGADGSSFNVGFNSTGGFWGEGPNAPAFCLTFHVWQSRTNGIYLFDSSGNQVGFYNYAVGENVWRPVRVLYTRSTTNTWQIFFNNTNIINYSNPNNESWVTSTSGAIFGFGSRTGGVTHNFYLRRFTLNSPDLQD